MVPDERMLDIIFRLRIFITFINNHKLISSEDEGYNFPMLVSGLKDIILCFSNTVSLNYCYELICELIL